MHWQGFSFSRDNIPTAAIVWKLSNKQITMKTPPSSLETRQVFEISTINECAYLVHVNLASAFIRMGYVGVLCFPASPFLLSLFRVGALFFFHPKTQNFILTTPLD